VSPTYHKNLNYAKRKEKKETQGCHSQKKEKKKSKQTQEKVIFLRLTI